jgi:ribosome-binding factor A
LVSRLRAKRISDRIREELSVLLLNKVSDPRLEDIYITEVLVDRELAFANIYVSTLEGAERSSEVLSGLIHAQSYLRHELSQKIALRTFPQLRFHWDPTPERAEQIERLITSIHIDTPDEKE